MFSKVIVIDNVQLLIRCDWNATGHHAGRHEGELVECGYKIVRRSFTCMNIYHFPQEIYLLYAECRSDLEARPAFMGRVWFGVTSLIA